jgi:hypothetical protein
VSPTSTSLEHHTSNNPAAIDIAINIPINILINILINIALALALALGLCHHHHPQHPYHHPQPLNIVASCVCRLPQVSRPHDLLTGRCRLRFAAAAAFGWCNRAGPAQHRWLVVHWKDNGGYIIRNCQDPSRLAYLHTYLPTYLHTYMVVRIKNSSFFSSPLLSSPPSPSAPVPSTAAVAMAVQRRPSQARPSLRRTQMII